MIDIWSIICPKPNEALHCTTSSPQKPLQQENLKPLTLSNNILTQFASSIAYIKHFLMHLWRRLVALSNLSRRHYLTTCCTLIHCQCSTYDLVNVGVITRFLSSTRHIAVLSELSWGGNLSWLIQTSNNRNCWITNELRSAEKEFKGI